MKCNFDFGFVTGGHEACMFMAQATLASMRHFCPGVPIALLVDGDFDVTHLIEQYGVIPLRVDDFPSREMRNLVGRSFHAKHVPMWEGPFENYVWVDADAIVWGDITSQVNRNVDFHIFRSERDAVVPSNSNQVPPWMAHFYFDPEKIKALDAEFCWQETKYFCPGVFAARRGAIPFEEYAKVLAWEKAHPGTFAWGDMGMINYLVHSRAQRGELKIAFSDLQDMWVHNGKEELVSDCLGAGWHFPKAINRPRVAHFCGRKPHLYDIKSYSRPFTIARLEHYRPLKGSLGAWAAILFEEWLDLFHKIKKKFEKNFFHAIQKMRRFFT